MPAASYSNPPTIARACRIEMAPTSRGNEIPAYNREMQPHSSAAHGSSTPPSGSSPTDGPEPRASRRRFERYRRKVKNSELPKGSIHGSGETRRAKDRVRSSMQLVWQFLRLLIPFRPQVIWILVSVTASTLIGLLPPAGTKFIIDYGLSGHPLPAKLLAQMPSLGVPKQLLFFLREVET